MTFSPKVKSVSRSLGLVDPAVVQGMYIFKLPRIGTAGVGEGQNYENKQPHQQCTLYAFRFLLATPHQDGTFLINDPPKLVGCWFALHDATEENGCLWFAPGSHRNPVTRLHLLPSTYMRLRLFLCWWW